MNRPLRVMLATPYGQDGMGGIDRLNDAIIEGFFRHGVHGVICKRLVTRGKGSLLAAQGVFAGALLRFAAAAAQGEVDLLHIHLSVRGSSYRKTVLANLACALGIPYVVHLHGTDFREYCDAAPAWLRAGITRMFTKSAGVIVLGAFWADVVREIAPAAAGRITILPNATVAAPPARGGADEAVRITFLGQLGSRKGSADLLQALALLKDQPRWQATLAGDGAIAETRAHMTGLGLKNITIPGWMSAVERSALLAETDMLVLPSYAENLPMVILEAFAHGIPVITTPVGAIPEVVVPERNGLLVNPGDVAALAAAIDRLIGDPALRRSMGAAARQDHAAKYEMGRYLQRLSTLWGKAHAASTQKMKDARASL